MSEDNVTPGEVLENGDDLITRREALKAALDWKVNPRAEVFDAIKAAITARLRSVLKAENWVSVKDRLPDAKGTYMVYAPGYKPGSSRRQPNHNGIMFSYWNGNAWSIEITEGYMYRKVLVQYWTLPSAPEGEKNATD